MLIPSRSLPQGVFKIGEQVKCLVMGLDPGYTNISLSVAGALLRRAVPVLGACPPATARCTRHWAACAFPTRSVPQQPAEPEHEAMVLASLLIT